MMLISVVFPAPFGPNRAKISPRRMSRLMFLSAWKPESLVFARSDTETMGCKTTSRSTIVSSSSFIPLLLLARTWQRHATGWGHYRVWLHGQETCAPNGSTVFNMYLRTGQTPPSPTIPASVGCGSDQRPATALPYGYPR